MHKALSRSIAVSPQYRDRIVFVSLEEVVERGLTVSYMGRMVLTGAQKIVLFSKSGFVSQNQTVGTMHYDCHRVRWPRTSTVVPLGPRLVIAVKMDSMATPRSLASISSERCKLRSAWVS